MKRRHLVVLLWVNVIALVCLAVFMPHLMVAPGKLIDAHAELASDCFACHSPFTGSSPAKCIECHAVEKIGLETTKGLSIADERKNVAFHQRLIEKDCVACHSDHRGVQAFRPISRFSHGLIEVEIRERCDGCHRKPPDALHRGVVGNCGECHTLEAWTPATFDHEQYFRFDRAHTTDCVTCHIEGDYATYTCYGCHEHSRSKIREEHIEEGIYDYENCAECHRSGDEDEAEAMMRRRHSDERETRRERHEAGDRDD